MGSRKAEAGGHDLSSDSRTAWAVVDGLESHIAVLDSHGVIVRINRAWAEFATRNPLPGSKPPRNTGVGANYLETCRAATGYSSETAIQAHRGISDVIAGRRREFKLEYPCHGPSSQRWFRMRVTPIPRTRPRQVVVAHVDISAQMRAQFEVQRLASELTDAFHTFRDSAAKLKAVIGPPPSADADDAPASVGRRGKVAKAWLADAQRLRLLSSREKDVLAGLARGERLADIAAQLGLSAKSVTTYRARLMEKLKVESTAELISLVARTGVIR